MASSGWVWSAEHSDWYFPTCDSSGKLSIVWAKQLSAQPATQHLTQNDSSNVRTDSGSSQTALMPAPGSWQDRQQEPNFIAGTPEEGWYNRLDSNYRMRTASEARQFFKLGRVFAMLYHEAAGGTTRPGADDEAFTVVKYGEAAYRQIRRFVVVSVRRNFVHACAISTYSNQGTLKRGCDPSEHALVYNTGVDPEACYFLGEKERGLYKAPIEVLPADSNSYLRRESRIRFGKIYSIEWNIQIKDLGRVVSQHLSLLAAHYDEETQRWDPGA